MFEELHYTVVILVEFFVKMTVGTFDSIQDSSWMKQEFAAQNPLPLDLLDAISSVSPNTSAPMTSTLLLPFCGEDSGHAASLLSHH